MSSDGRFVAQILETSAVGFAGLTASLLLERKPDIAERYQPDGFATWKAELHRWLLDLSAAIDAGEPKLFESRMLWTKSAYLARKTSSEDLEAGLAALRDTLQERLPEGAAEAAVATVEGAISAVSLPGSGESGDDDPQEGTNRATLTYLKTILEGRPRAAIDQLLAAVDGGTPIKDAYLQVLIPAQRETGRMWHGGTLGVAEEHVITATTQRAMAVLCERARSSKSIDKTVLLACVAGDIHDIGVRAISDFFEMDGWRAVNLGPDVPQEEIARSVQLFDPDVVVLAATLDPHLKGVQRTIERIRALEDREVKIIVGGPAFERAPDLWRKFGADGHAVTLDAAVTLGSKLTG